MFRHLVRPILIVPFLFVMFVLAMLSVACIIGCERETPSAKPAPKPAPKVTGAEPKKLHKEPMPWKSIDPHLD